ncbi:MAG: 5-(carboxyamino)imidazole ribonucleotide synthase, partial [Pyrinomonadaceae bacterium]
MRSHKQILPGATIGVLGSGQLGRMFTIPARRMGYIVHTYSPEIDTPTGQIADKEITASYDDIDALRDFARNVDCITFEFENIPAASLKEIESEVLIFPDAHVLYTTQNRIREKTFLQSTGFPVTPFRPVHKFEDLLKAASELKLPVVLKTAGFGYDGKGQRRITSRQELASAFEELRGQDAVLEEFLDLEKEISVIAARGYDKTVAHFGVIENTHRNHILDLSISPAGVDQQIARTSIEITTSLLHEFNYIGVLCVEFFITREGKLYINEIAPRAHNSGHLTIDSHATSQFEQQLRAICGLPLGATEMLCPAAAMTNLLGDLWTEHEPDWAAALAMPMTRLHLYGKRIALPGRKMG